MPPRAGILESADANFGYLPRRVAHAYRHVRVEGVEPAGLKCTQVILTNEPGRQRWEEMGFFAAHGANNPGVVANIAAYRHGEEWLDEVPGYLDENRRLLVGLLGRHLPEVRYRPPDGTYLAWFDCSAMNLPDSPGGLVTSRAQLTVVDGPAFGDGGAGAFRFNFATPRPILTEMVGRIGAACAPPNDFDGGVAVPRVPAAASVPVAPPVTRSALP